MLLEPVARNNLMTLLRLAREDADDLRADLADVEAALTAADVSLAAPSAHIGPDLSAETDAAGEERSRARRMRLFALRETLERAAAEIRSNLDAATAELQKLERLIALGADAGRSDLRLTATAPRAGMFAAPRRLAS